MDVTVDHYRRCHDGQAYYPAISPLLLGFIATWTMCRRRETMYSTRRRQILRSEPSESKVHKRALMRSPFHVMTDSLNALPLFSKDYEIKTPNDEVISFNVCQNVKTDLFGIKDDSINAGDVQGFIRRGHGDFVIG
jgi:hypothetical protein